MQFIVTFISPAVDVHIFRAVPKGEFHHIRDAFHPWCLLTPEENLRALRTAPIDAVFSKLKRPGLLVKARTRDQARAAARCYLGGKTCTSLKGAEVLRATKHWATPPAGAAS